MSTTTTRTNLEVRVNTQDIRKADRAIRQAFDPRAVKQLHTAVAQMTRAVESMTKATASLTAQIKASATAGKGFQTLATDLAKARGEAERLNRELARMGGRGPGGGFGGGGSGGGGFFGFGGGGPRQYTSGSSAGMGGEARYAPGQMGMPTMQAAATALGAIPYVGLAAGGALMASAAYYQRAKADARSRRDTFAMLGGTARAKLGAGAALSGVTADPAMIAKEMSAIDTALAQQREAQQRTAAIQATVAQSKHPYEGFGGVGSTRGVSGVAARSPGLLGGLFRSLTGQTLNNPQNQLTVGDPVLNPVGMALAGSGLTTPLGVAIPTLPTPAEEAAVREKAPRWRPTTASGAGAAAISPTWA
jgi:hypothetical protein